MSASPPQPVACRPEAFRLFAAALPRIETTKGLVDAATAIAAHELPGAEPQMAHAAIGTLAEHVRDRAPRLVESLGADGVTLCPVDPHNIEPLLAHVHHVLFDEERYRGDTDDYYNPLNSYLPAVMERRIGLPVTLTLIYKAVAEHVGVRVEGIDAPGHFMAGV